MKQFPTSPAGGPNGMQGKDGIMGGFFDGFVRQASITKLNQNNRDMKDMAKGIGQVVAHAVAQQERINAETATNEELREEIQRLQQEVVDLNYGIDKRDAHLAAKAARYQYVMSELDKASGELGIENPARKQAYKDPDTLRIPKGPRARDSITTSDHAYIEAFANIFVSNFQKKWPHVDSWKDFLHARISW